MKSKAGKIIKTVIFVILVLAMIAGLTRLFLPKYYYQTNIWPTSSTLEGFYNIEKNTVDVLFMGSSHSISSFSPQKLYNDTGITSYNLGAEMQSPVISYWWLKEALNYQSPQVLIFEGRMLLEAKDTVLNTEEAMIRKSVDRMRWGSVKRDMINDICRLDGELDKMSFYFTLDRFHERWKSFGENDYSLDELRQHNELKGFSALTGCFETVKQNMTVKDQTEYSPVRAGVWDGEGDINALCLEYFEKIAQLCRECGIKLILAYTPDLSASIFKYNSLKKIADDEGIEYIDFNEIAVYEACGYAFDKDNQDDDHANMRGAEKITEYMGNVLSGDYGLVSHADSQWEDTKEYYEWMKRDFYIVDETDPLKYLELINDERYSLFFSASGNIGKVLHDDIQERLRALGIGGDLYWTFNKSYAAAVTDTGIQEAVDTEPVQIFGNMRGGLSIYEVSSSSSVLFGESSILLDTWECALNTGGLNIAVYNNERKRLIDSVSIQEDHVLIR